MNITFICGTLAIGKSGVGDYTRKLAAELIQQGHQASVIAVRDFSATTILEEWQTDQNIKVPVLRFPMGTGFNVQAKRIQQFLDQQSTTWLSLQYVPFSFHKRGLHWTWNAFFEKIGEDKHWHLMFHELWLGLNKGASIKEVCWGEAQRQGALNLIKKLKPACVHTHANVYQAVLSHNGIAAQQLPLFSNIDPNLGTTQLERTPHLIHFAIFGAIHPTTKQKPFLDELEFENQQSNRNAHIIFLGRNGALKKQWIQAITQTKTISFEDLGELDAKAIAYHLSNANIGLSFTPLPLTEKSGTIACYWASDLAVLTLADDWSTRKKIELTFPEGVVPYKTGHLQHFLETYSSLTITYKSPAEIATQFVSQAAESVCNL